MNVTHVDGITGAVRAEMFAAQGIGRVGANHPTDITTLEVVAPPKNGNPGIVPPWLQNKNTGIVPPWMQAPFHILPFPFPQEPKMGAELIGIVPVDPNTPVIM